MQYAPTPPEFLAKMALQARCGLLARSIARDTFDCLLRASASNLSAVSSSGASTSRGRQSAQRISIRAMCDGPGFCMPSTADVPDVTPFWELKMSKRFTKMDFNQVCSLSDRSTVSMLLQIHAMRCETLRATVRCHCHDRYRKTATPAWVWRSVLASCTCMRIRHPSVYTTWCSWTE